MIEVELPDGTVVEFPDGTSQDVMRQAIQKQFGGGQSEQPSTAYDMVRGLGTGIRQGAEGLASMFGDVNKLNGSIAGFAAEKLGASPETADTVRNIARRVSLTPFALTSDEVQSATEAVVGEHYDPQTRAGKYSRTFGQFLPGALVGQGSLGARVVTQALLPALGSETAGQLTEGSKYEPYARVAGALVGSLAPAVASRIVSPMRTSPERQAMVDALTREGIDTTAGQRTGSEKLRYMESELGGMAGQRMMEQQGEQFTAAALRRAGIDAKRATPEVIDDAFTRIGQQFDDLAARNKIVPDKQMVDDFVDVWRDYSNITNESTRAPIIRNTIEDIVNRAKNAGSLSGEYYNSVRSEVARTARGTSNPEVKSALRGIQDVLDDAMERSLQAVGSPDMAAWREARNQYRNMLVIEKAATGAGENAAAGLISPSQLRNATVQQGRRAYARGQGDFAELARAGEGVMKPLPQSGTAPRTAARAVGASAPALMGALAGSAAAPGVGTILGGAAGAAAPYVIGRALLSGVGRNYLSNQLAAGLPTGDPRIAAVIAALLNRPQSAAPAIAP